jgi:hypothetical protein
VRGYTVANRGRFIGEEGHMARVLRLWLAITLVLAGCTTESSRVREYLDPQTAVTIRTLAAPVVYAHDAPELAANTRDYLSLGLVEVNNMGARKHYLALISWSTIDRARLGVGPAPVPERFEVVMGGKLREFTPASHEPRSLGIGGTPFRPPSGYAGEAWYAVTPADLRALAAAPADSITLLQESGRVAYRSWKAADAAITEFVRDIPDTVSADPSRR